MLPERFTLTMRYVPSGLVDRATWRNTLMFRAHSDLQVGVEYNPLIDEVGPLVNLRLLRETRNQPGLAFGTSSDRIGTPFGRAYYGTLMRDLEPNVGLPISVYAGALFGTFDDEFVFPFGLNYRLSSRWTLTPQFDGKASHGLATYSWGKYQITGLLIRWRHPGFAVTLGF